MNWFAYTFLRAKNGETVPTVESYFAVVNAADVDSARLIGRRKFRIPLALKVDESTEVVEEKVHPIPVGKR